MPLYFSCLFSQNTENGDLSIGELGFYLNDLAFQISNSEAFQLSGKLKSIDFGFKSIQLSKKV